MVNKYIGETEENLSRIFNEAEASNAIIFFDEVDALFGKRSDVSDAHGGYANIEIAYLLQRMEEYEGIAILATNPTKNMDEAFTGRMHFTVQFPFPEEEHRFRIRKTVSLVSLGSGLAITHFLEQDRVSSTKELPYPEKKHRKTQGHN